MNRRPTTDEMDDVLGQCVDGLSSGINDHPAIREVFGAFAVEELTIAYSTGLERGKKTTELLYRNW